MKNSIVTPLLCLLILIGYSQNSKYELPARQTPTVKKERLSTVNYINDITPDLWRSLVLPNNEHDWLDKRRIGVFPQPENAVYPQDNYKYVVDIVSVEVSATCNGKTKAAKNTSDKLTAEQKNILAAADMNTDIRVKIKFKYKAQTADDWGPRNKMLEGVSAVTVVPQTEAEYPGGYKQLSAYFVGNVINKLSEKNASDKIQRAVVRFTVNEEGQIVKAEISRTSTDAAVDKLLLEAINKMPKWKPAENSNGIRVKQEFVIPFSVGC